MKSYNLRFKIIFLSIIFLGIFGLVKSSWAADYFVATFGNNSNQGTQLQPWRTIGKAASTLKSGDTVYVQEGTYPEVVTVGASGSAGNPITYRANGIVNVQRWAVSSKNYVTIDGFHSVTGYAPGGDQFLVSIYGTSSYVTVQNMTLTISNPTTVAPCINEGGLIQTTKTTSHITVMGNTLSRSCYYPAVQTAGDHQTYSNNTIFDILTDAFQGEGLSNSTISGNAIGPFIILGYHNDCYQLFSVAANTPNNEITIENNICHDGDQPGNMSLDGQSSSGIYIRNNIFYNFTGQFGLGIPNTKVYNNVFFRTATVTNFTALGTTGWGTTITGIEVKNNFFIGIGVPTYNYDYGTGYTVTATNAGASNNFYARDPAWTNPWGVVPFAIGPNEPNMVNGGNPLFTDYATHNFTLQTTSPARDTGITISSFAVDKNKVSRPQGSAWDIGAYEYFSGAPIDTTPPANPTGLSVV